MLIEYSETFIERPISGEITFFLSQDRSFGAKSVICIWDIAYGHFSGTFAFG